MKKSTKSKDRWLLVFMVLWSAASMAQETIDIEQLNGTWLQACDSLITGEYAGEIECSIEMDTQVRFKIERNKGVMFRHDRITSEKDSSQVLIKTIGNSKYLIGSRNNKPWIKKIFKITNDSLGIYSTSESHITMYLR